MERLNDIMGKAAQRRQHYTQEAPVQGQRQQHTQSPLTRRPLPEQTARLGQQRAYSVQPRNNYLPAPKAYAQRGQSEPGPRRGRADEVSPLSRSYQRQQRQQRPAPGAAYQQQPEEEEDDLLRTRPLPPRVSEHYLQTNDYSAPPPADVYAGWEEDGEEEEGMRYGDWERESDEMPTYRRADIQLVPSSGTDYPQMTRELPRVIPDDARTEGRAHATRDLRGLRMPVTGAQQLRPRLQEAQPQYHHRMTQPLNPRAISGVNRELSQPPRPLPPARRPVSQERNVPALLSAPTRSVCPKCKGAGYLRLDVPYGDPNFGKPVACECKEAERKEKRRQQLREMSNLDAFRNCSFRNFNPRVPGVQEAYQMAREYAQEPGGWLLLIGPNGTGKTHLAAAIANESLDAGSVVLFAVVPDLLDHLRAAFAPNSPELYDQLFAKMREAELLVLDDLGAQQSSPWANEKLFQLLNYRYNMGMPTVITTNLRGLQGVDERIRSRLNDASLVMTVNIDRARDYRPHHPRQL